jgi:hypothetical protein
MAVLQNPKRPTEMIAFDRVALPDGTDTGLVKVRVSEAVGREFNLDRNYLSDNFNAWIDAKGKADG